MNLKTMPAPISEPRLDPPAETSALESIEWSTRASLESDESLQGFQKPFATQGVQLKSEFSALRANEAMIRELELEMFREELAKSRAALARQRELEETLRTVKAEAARLIETQHFDFEARLREMESKFQSRFNVEIRKKETTHATLLRAAKDEFHSKLDEYEIEFADKVEQAEAKHAAKLAEAHNAIDRMATEIERQGRNQVDARHDLNLSQSAQRILEDRLHRTQEENLKTNADNRVRIEVLLKQNESANREITRLSNLNASLSRQIERLTSAVSKLSKNLSEIQRAPAPGPAADEKKAATESPANEL